MKNRLLVLFLIVALLIPAIPSVAAPPSAGGGPSAAAIPEDLVHEMLFYPVADTWVDAWTPNANYGSRAELYLRSGGIKGALLKFDISSIPVGATVVDAQLTLQRQPDLVPGPDHPFTVSAYQIYRDWNETEATWLHATATDMWGTPGLGDTASDRAASAEDAASYPIDLTAMESGTGEIFIPSMVQDWVSDPTANYGVFLGLTATRSMQVAIASSDYQRAAFHPRLKVVYTTYPLAGNGTEFFKSSEDTWVNEWAPNANYEGLDRMRVRTGGEHNALVKFPLAADAGSAEIPAEAIVAKAYLWVYAYEDTMFNTIRSAEQAPLGFVGYWLQNPYLLQAFPATTDWTAAQATWTLADALTHWSMPGGDAGPMVGSTTVTLPIGWIQVDVTEAVQAWHGNLAASDGNFGLILKASGVQSAAYSYLTSEWADPAFAPTLVVHWVQKPEDILLNVVATNDFHGALNGRTYSWSGGNMVGGLPWIAGYYNVLRDLNPGGVIALDAGDMMQGTLESNYFFGESTIAGFNALGLMGATFGNHEFDWRVEKLLERVAQSEFPWLSCSIRLKADGTRPDWAIPYTYLDVKGVKVGLIGVAYPDTGAITNPMYTGHLDFTDPATEVNAIVDEVWDGGADVVIVVAHVGGFAPDYGEVAALANALDPDKVNLLITGHTHSSIATTINGIPVIQSFNGGSAFGRVDLMVDPWLMKVASFTVKPTQNVYNTWAGGPAMYEGQPVARDETVAAVLQPYFDEVAVLKNTVIGETTVPIIRNYRYESAMGNLVTDAMRTVDPAIDFAMTNSGGLRADLDAGPITFGQMFAVLPFGNTFTKVWLTGEQLLSTLEDGVSGLHGLVQASGLQFTFDYDLPMHSRIIGDVINLNTGLPIDPAETYLVVVNNFMAAGGDHYGTLPLAPQEETYIVDIDWVSEYVKTHSPLTPVVEGRITALGTPPP